MRNSRVADAGVSLNGNLLEFVDIFCYLGSMFGSTGGTEADIKARIGKTRTAFIQLKKICRSSVISRQTKKRLFNAEQEKTKRNMEEVCGERDGAERSDMGVY